MITLNITLFVWCIWGLSLLSGIGAMIDASSKSDSIKFVTGLIFAIVCIVCLVI